MVIDWEKAWARLAGYVASKPDHGARGLALEMNRILADCEVEESRTARDLRLLGGSVEINVQTGGELTDPSDGGSLQHRSKETDDARSNHQAAVPV